MPNSAGAEKCGRYVLDRSFRNTSGCCSGSLLWKGVIMRTKGKASKVASAAGNSGSLFTTLSRTAWAACEGDHLAARPHKALTGRALTGPSGWEARFKFAGRVAVAHYLPGLKPGVSRTF